MVLKNTPVGEVAFIVGIGLALSAMSAMAEDDSPQVLKNGGFETRAADHAGPYAWSFTQAPQTEGLVACAWDDRVFHSGARSVSISIEESHPDKQIDYNWNQAVTEFDPGETYEVTGWIRAYNLDASPVIVVQCWDSTFTKMLGFATTQRDYEVTGTTEWTQVKATISVPAETGRVMLLAGVRAPDNRGGRVWFDDIQITREKDRDE